MIRKAFARWHRTTVVSRNVAAFVVRRAAMADYSTLLGSFAAWVVVVESKRLKIRQNEEALYHYGVTLAVKAVHGLVANVDAMAAACVIADVGLLGSMQRVFDVTLCTVCLQEHSARRPARLAVRCFAKLKTWPHRWFPFFYSLCLKR
jgi:hypothetical protein